MNVKRYTARTSRDALTLVRQALGDDAIVLSTRPSPEGVEVLAMAPDGMAQIERMADSLPRTPAPKTPRPAPRHDASAGAEVADDVEQLAMSTLSFQDYVRERVLKRRQAALDGSADMPAAMPGPKAPGVAPSAAGIGRATSGAAARPAREPVREQAPTPMPPARDSFAQRLAERSASAARLVSSPRTALPTLADVDVEPAPPKRALRDLASAPAVAVDGVAAAAVAAAGRRDQNEMMSELRSMKGLIEERFGALAFMEKLQRQPRQAQLAQKLLDCGFSPVLIRKLLDALDPSVADEIAWASGVLERNLGTNEAEAALEEAGGVYALIGSTGAGKTTSTAKIAAAFAARHGAGQLGLITLDAYRVAAHEQLRAYGRILGVPVHTAHDRASLEDLLDLLSAKKMVLIDTAGMAQRDARTQELLEMLSHRSVHKLLVLDASRQGETLDDVIQAWRANQCKGVILSKIDEAVKLAPALDALIRHRLKVVGVANGQRVPEDWHRLSAHALVHRAVRGASVPAYRLEPAEVQLVFAAAAMAPMGARGDVHAGY